MSICRIRKNIHGEYEVPEKNPHPLENDCLYFTDDKDDAIGTAKMMHGDDVQCVFRSGTYQSEL